MWNKRYVETNQGDFGGITVDELERALKKMEQEFNARKIMKEEKTPKCPICGEGGLHILTLSYLSDKARANPLRYVRNGHRYSRYKQVYWGNERVGAQ